MEGGFEGVFEEMSKIGKKYCRRGVCNLNIRNMLIVFLLPEQSLFKITIHPISKNHRYVSVS